MDRHFSKFLESNWQRHHIECHYGWLPLIRELHERMLELDPKYQIQQVKEKFGVLRFYFSTQKKDSFAKMNELVSEYESKSGHMCEWCGDPAETRTENGWMRTICDDCNEHVWSNRHDIKLWKEGEARLFQKLLDKKIIDSVPE